MRVVFLGVGEAFDADYANNSHLVVTRQTRLLLDCGYSVPQSLWQFDDGDPELLDAICISHQHYDNFGGLPPVLMRMWEDGRKKPLTIICQKGLRHSFAFLMEFAYGGFRKKFKYKINLVEAHEGQNVDFQDVRLSFERTQHSSENLAVRITDGARSMAYTGDGSPMPESEFYFGLDLLIMESYLYDKRLDGHSSVLSAVSFAEKNGVRCLALTHLNRNMRASLFQSDDRIRSNGVKVIVPEPGVSWG